MTTDENKWKAVLERERIAKCICAELNNFVDLKPALMTIMGHVKALTGCQAVSIRLYDDGDYPYYVYDGFPESFIQKENRLCAKDDHGNTISSPDGKGYRLECMCGNVIRGRFDSALPFFTKQGSFWSNNTSKLLASTSEEDRQTNTRNYCNSCGYESVGLVPVRARGETIGLIQLNDMRTDMFTKELIEYMEMIGEQTGLAIINSLTYEKLKTALADAKILRGLIPICAQCKKVRDDKGYWKSVESYIREHSDAEFSHGYCPECFDKAIKEVRDFRSTDEPGASTDADKPRR